MKTILKSYKYKIYPNFNQTELLSKHFGANRFIYNYFLNKRKDAYLNDKNTLNYYDTSIFLTKIKKDINFKWLKEINSQSLQSSIKNLDVAYNRFFNKISKFPKFKKKTNKETFKVPQNFKIKDGKFYMPKFKNGIKINYNKETLGKIIYATISKTTTNKYFVSITCEVEYKPYKKTNSNVGIDTGIKELAILSNGKIYENIKVLKKYLKTLKYTQRQLSKKQKGSNSWNKQKIKLALIHERIRNIRKDYLHKITTDIIKNHDIICIEDLNIKIMMQNHQLSQAFSDVSLRTFYTMLEYKANWNDKKLIKIDRFFPSSKTCSCCGWIKQDLNLSIRKWNCIKCDTNHDRDLNASKNILKQGLNILSGSGYDSNIKQKQMESLSLDKAMKSQT